MTKLRPSSAPTFLTTARLLVLPAFAVLAACSSASAPTGTNDRGTQGDETWGDGKSLSGTVTIGSSSTVTIKAGAKITVAANTKIVVKGSLKSEYGDKHAIVGGTEDWEGIDVEDGGSIELDGVDVGRGKVTLNVKAGAVVATFRRGVIAGAAEAFHVEEGAQLNVDHLSVTAGVGTSRIAGKLVASYMDFDGNGQDGIATDGPKAYVDISDSLLHGKGGNDDMLWGSSGGHFRVQYTEIYNAHCSFHFDNINTFDISYVWSHNNLYGMMLDGSEGEGSRTITNTNFTDNTALALQEDQTATNGAISITNCYFDGNKGGKQVFRPDTKIKVSNDANAKIPGTGPRPEK
ncbi:MAG: hypothetical protein U0169_21400 [Polyangiaceae bacterium]